MKVDIPVKLDLRAVKEFHLPTADPHAVDVQTAALELSVDVTGVLSDLIIALAKRHGVTLAGTISIAGVEAELGGTDG